MDDIALTLIGKGALGLLIGQVPEANRAAWGRIGTYLVMILR